MNEQPECCTKYAGHVFVFGSNLAGRHGKGAALHARKKHEAANGIGVGWQPGVRSYAIPTKDANLRPLPLETIRDYVRRFLDAAKSAEIWEDFYVTKVGCGLAGYNEADIAPMFRDAPPNCVLPEGWRS